MLILHGKSFVNSRARQKEASCDRVEMKCFTLSRRFSHVITVSHTLFAGASTAVSWQGFPILKDLDKDLQITV
jgi:hypothetical protein